jgi:hypothetical protein
MEQRAINLMVGAATAVAVTVIGSDAFAVVTPAGGTFAYDVYEIAVTDILKGPIGFVCGLGAVCYGAVLAIQQRVMGAVPALLGGGALLKADAIVNSLGCIF